MLKKLTLHGFKSFSDRTDIVLGSGITAIVGPNGCGKSNLADALRWALGEQNPRILRSGKLQDIIFSGTETRKAMGMAEVRLLFDEVSDGSETEIIRRLTMDGGAEYRLNGRICRWKDIVEILAGTGLSHTGYVVIGQGTVQELAAGRPEDRRTWIEEASGVARVRLDKRDMESKLEAARADIVRLEDLLVELQARKESLQQDVEVSRRYRNLRERERDLKRAMWLDQYDEAAKKVLALTRRLEKQRSILEEADMEAPKLRDEEAEQRASRQSILDRYTQVSSEREEVLRELLSLEKKQDALRGQIAALTRELESRSARRAAIKSDLERLDKEISTLQSQKVHVSEKHEKVTAEAALWEKERAAREKSRKETADRAIALRGEVVSLTGELRVVEREMEELRRRLDETRKRKAEVSAQLQNAREERERLTKQLASLNEQRQEKAAKMLEYQKTLADLEARRAKVSAAQSQAASFEKNLGARISGVRARRKLLEDMERSFEGYGRGPKTVLTAAKNGILKGIRGSIGETLSCEPRYLQALSAAVGGAAEDIIVDDEDCAKAAITYLKQAKGGRATFLPLTTVRPRSIASGVEAVMAQIPGVRPLLSVVSCPQDLQQAARYLIGRIALADTMDIGLSFMRKTGWAVRVVTLSGESIEPGGAISGGDAPRSESLFRRKREIAELRESDEALTKELEASLAERKRLESEASRLEEEISKARASLEEFRGLISRLDQDGARLEGARKSAHSSCEKLEGEIPGLEEREKVLSKDLSEAAFRVKTLSEEMSARESELKKIEAVVKDDLQQDREVDERGRRLISEKEKTESELAALSRRLEGLIGERSGCERNLAVEEKEIERGRALLRSAEEDEKSSAKRVAALDEKSTSLAQALQKMEAEREDIDARLTEIRSNLERMEQERAQALTRIEETSEELEAGEKALGDTRRFIKQEFGIEDPSVVVHPRIPRGQAESDIDDVDRELRALGNVNLKAEQEFAELSDRISLITHEKTDVEMAIQEIVRARELVEKEMETRFLKTFESVRESFRGVFQELFGGGEADLRLVEDSLGVEVMAEPPGRRQKHLNLLSGGERSLCGIALIFAILSVKPSPLIVLDEADTALDEANVVRFSRFLKRYSEKTQFLVITHQKATMEAADLIYGVTMEEPGVSKVFGMRLENR